MMPSQDQHQSDAWMLTLSQSCLTLCDLMDCNLPGFSVLGIFSRQEYWIRLPFPTPGDFPDPGTAPLSLGTKVRPSLKEEL